MRCCAKSAQEIWAHSSIVAHINNASVFSLSTILLPRSHRTMIARYINAWLWTVEQIRGVIMLSNLLLTISFSVSSSPACSMTLARSCAASVAASMALVPLASPAKQQRSPSLSTVGQRSQPGRLAPWLEARRTQQPGAVTGTVRGRQMDTDLPKRLPYLLDLVSGRYRTLVWNSSRHVSCGPKIPHCPKLPTRLARCVVCSARPAATADEASETTRSGLKPDVFSVNR